jgi:hypothetical protein
LEFQGMIRRIYILPLQPGISAAETGEFVTAFDDAGRYISGLLDSFAGLDLHSSTVVWEMTFDNEENYTGPYMVHPYHIATLDNYLLADSPQRLARDFESARYRLADAAPRLEAGVRRIVLLELPAGADASALAELAAPAAGVATSALGADDLAWRGSKGRAWTHVWEQGFTDMAALDAYLRTPAGAASSSRDGFRYLNVPVTAARVLTYPFTLSPAQSPPAVVPDGPVLYTMTCRTAPEDVDALIGLLTGDYDPALARVGGKLLHRWRTLDHAYREAEVQSTWQLDSLTAFRDFRQGTVAGDDPSWNRFVLNGMPLVKSGTRRFYRLA